MFACNTKTAGLQPYHDPHYPRDFHDNLAFALVETA